MNLPMKKHMNPHRYTKIQIHIHLFRHRLCTHILKHMHTHGMFSNININIYITQMWKHKGIQTSKLTNIKLTHAKRHKQALINAHTCKNIDTCQSHTLMYKHAYTDVHKKIHVNSSAYIHATTYIKTTMHTETSIHMQKQILSTTHPLTHKYTQKFTHNMQIHI